MPKLPELSEAFVLRDITEADREFLLALFRSTREHLAYLPLAAAQLDTLYEQQFEFQQHSYTQQFPKAWNWLVEFDREPVGKLVVDRSGDWLHLVDISLIPPARGRGLGQQLLKALQAWAELLSCGISLQVDKQNSGATKLYLGLGFYLVEEDEIRERLCWQTAGLQKRET